MQPPPPQLALFVPDEAAKTNLIKREVAFEDFGHRPEPVDREEWGDASRQKLVSDDADAPHVRGRRRLGTVHDLGRHVLDGPGKRKPCQWSWKVILVRGPWWW